MQPTPARHSARPFRPDNPRLVAPHRVAAGCRACPRYARATQTAFGRGAARARMLPVGEQPRGEAGRPSAGPAGRPLDRSLAAAGIVGSDTYVTNVVKHFNSQARGKHRLRPKPGAGKIPACLAWLQEEIELIPPQVAARPGAAAAQGLPGKTFRAARPRPDHGAGLHALATVHPASIPRLPDDGARGREMSRFAGDLQAAASLLNRLRPV